MDNYFIGSLPAFRAQEHVEQAEQAKAIAELAEKGITRTYLYGGKVTLDFNPKSSKYRYVVTDRDNKVKEASVRGVTSCIGDVLDKPGLKTWPMNMSHGYLFGQTWVTIDSESGAGEYHYNPKTAQLQPATPYSEEELQELMVNASKQWTKRSDRGKDIGTHVHSMCEAYLKDGLDEEFKGVEGMSKEDVAAVNKAVATFKAWWKSLPDAELIAVERVVYSRALSYAGTFDLAVKIAGKKYLLDLKTTNRSKEAPLGIYPEHFLQLGAYSFAHTEETGQEYDDVGVVNIGKDGRLALATASDMNITVDECQRAFAFGVRLHDWVKKIKPLTKEQGFSSCLYYGSKDKVGLEQENKKKG